MKVLTIILSVYLSEKKIKIRVNLETGEVINKMGGVTPPEEFIGFIKHDKSDSIPFKRIGEFNLKEIEEKYSPMFYTKSLIDSRYYGITSYEMPFTLEIKEEN